MDYSAQIQNYERDLTINKNIINQEYWHIGTAVMEHKDLAEPVKDENQKNLSELLETAGDHNSKKDELIAHIGKIEELVNAQQDVEGSIKGREDEIVKLRSEYREMLRDFGAKAFELYASSPQSYLPLAPGFSELDSLHRDQFNVESRIEGLQKKSESDPIIKRLVSQTKLQFQKNQHKGLAKKISEALEKTGADLVKNRAAASDSQSSQLKGIMDPVVKQQSKIDEIQKIIEKQHKQLTEISAELTKQVGSSKPDAQITELQIRISEVDEEQRRILTDAGRLLYHETSSKPPETLSEFYGNITQLIEENRAKEEKIRRLQAAQKILALQEEKARFSLKEDKLTKQYDDLKEQIDRVKKTISDLDKEIASQGKIRGDEADLQ